MTQHNPIDFENFGLTLKQKQEKQMKGIENGTAKMSEKLDKIISESKINHEANLKKFL